MNKIISIIFLLLILTFLCQCIGKKIIYFYSLDRSQCITVINEGNTRYIIDGKHREIPKCNFVKLNTEKVSSDGDGLWICWENEKYKWEVTVDDAILVESTLDTTKYNFSTNLPLDERGIPTEMKFRHDGCAIFSFYLMRLSPNEGAIVEFEN